jgi:hypothetical protein
MDWLCIAILPLVSPFRGLVGGSARHQSLDHERWRYWDVFTGSVATGYGAGSRRPLQTPKEPQEQHGRASPPYSKTTSNYTSGTISQPHLQKINALTVCFCKRFNVILGVMISLGSVGLVHNLSNSLHILRGELDLPSVHILSKVLQDIRCLSKDSRLTGSLVVPEVRATGCWGRSPWNTPRCTYGGRRPRSRREVSAGNLVGDSCLK